MQENRLLPPAKQKEIKDEIIKNNLDWADFTWENYKSEELLERSNSMKPILMQQHRLRAKLKNDYERLPQPQVSKLVHNETQAFFIFDRIDDKWMSKFSLGKDYGTGKKKFNSLTEQIEFAKNNWLDDLIQNLRAEELVKPQLKQLQVTESLKEELPKIPIANKNLTDIEKANLLYDEIKDKYPKTEEFKETRENETSILHDIEKIDDAIKLFGTESQDKKVALNQIREELTSHLPQTPDDWNKNFWKNATRRVSNTSRINPKVIIGLVAFIFAVIFIIAFFANLLKVKDSVSKEQIPLTNKVTQTPNITITPTPIQTSTNSNFIVVNANLPAKQQQEEIIVSDGQGKKAIKEKVIISVIGISFERTTSGALGYKVTGNIAEVGKKEPDFVRREVGYSTKRIVDNEIYEIRLISVRTSEATFLVTKIETKSKK